MLTTAYLHSHNAIHSLFSTSAIGITLPLRMQLLALSCHIAGGPLQHHLTIHCRTVQITKGQNTKSSSPSD